MEKENSNLKEFEYLQEISRLEAEKKALLKTIKILMEEQ